MSDLPPPKLSREPTAEELAFVEDVGVYMENAGLLRMAGRIVGWLMICDPAEQSADDLARVLRASKGSISTATRLLVQAQLIDRVSLPGQRRDYFRMRPDGWVERMVSATASITAFRRLLERGLSAVGDDPARRDRLTGSHEFYTWLEREFPLFLRRWQRDHPDRGGSPKSATPD